jgi:prepilin-type N-terminal cleavage/methylation domain-containing protein
MLRSQAHATNAFLTSRASCGPRGFTLVELLVASGIGLIVMAALATLLGLFSRTASSTQSIVDMTHRLRVVGDRLRKDLAGVTCKLEPPVSPDSDSGYFEIIEGPTRDALRYRRPKAWVTSDYFGDTDDGLLFTTRSTGEPFTGKYGSETIQSNTAEVAWFLSNGTLYRRQLLVVPYVPRLPFNLDETIAGVNDFNANGRVDVHLNWLALPSTANPTIKNPEVYSLEDLYLFCDLSVRRDIVPGPLNAFIPNTLGDLTKPINRFRHSATFPHPFIRSGASRPLPDTAVNRFNWVPPLTFDEPLPSPSPVPVSLPSRAGEDVILRNVLSFDVRIFDPDAPVKTTEDGSAALTPGDPAYVDFKNKYTAAKGAYVDLGWGSWDDIWPPPPPLPTALEPYELVVPVNRPTWTPNIPAFSFDIVPGTTPRTVNPPFTNRFPGFLGEDQNRNNSLDTGEDLLNNNYLDGPITPFQLFGMHWANVVQTGTNLVPSRNLDAFPLTYDTWSTHYESNGINDDSEDANGNGVLDPGEDRNSNTTLDGDSLIDEGTNGLDDNGDGIPDDPAERETSPPYPVPLRGIEVRIRCIEPTTKEIRQITIRHAFQ